MSLFRRNTMMNNTSSPEQLSIRIWGNYSRTVKVTDSGGNVLLQGWLAGDNYVLN